jgi:hypothetical protein
MVAEEDPALSETETLVILSIARISFDSPPFHPSSPNVAPYDDGAVLVKRCDDRRMVK